MTLIVPGAFIQLSVDFLNFLFLTDDNDRCDWHLCSLQIRYWIYRMQRTRQQNSEYMQVICEVVGCLINQLHHPLLSSLRPDEITEWFHQVKEEEVELAMQRLRDENRIR